MTLTTVREFNFDGLVGPSHNYAGLSFGNVASLNNVRVISNPRQAALQGLSKMRALAARGFFQAVLPPHRRPEFDFLRRLGFSGSDAQVLERAYRDAPVLLSCAYSAAPMWTANAATVSPSADCADGRVHLTVANLNSKLHRSYEQTQTDRILRALFRDEQHFVVHTALPPAPGLGDEGAANHTRFCAQGRVDAETEAGVEMFVYGRTEFGGRTVDPTRFPHRFPARQTLEASQSVARLHGLATQRTLFVQQNPAVIDQGVFHNDVIAVGNGNVLFYHQEAFLNTPAMLSSLGQAMASTGAELHGIQVNTAELSVADAVSSYLFNSQLLSKPDGRMLLVVPQQCQDNQAVARYLSGLLDSDARINELLSFDLTQSMRNGGGPACLRLRVALTGAQQAAMHQGVIMTEPLYHRLVQWVEQHYRDRLVLHDLADPALAQEIRTALEQLEAILDLPGLYNLG